ncbi:type IV pilus modification protein PilV [Dasania marina]|uniref:type IV pilus modification protein PilV n=1 Tax=Dasania marina TaxID=471499 RepID=UPI00036CE828|nr:type IV pilus modification protein PilV [Dasania marina]
MRKANLGVGLIEVMVSVLVLSVGLLGLLGLQSSVMRFNQGALYQTRATILAQDIMDRMRSNRSKASLYISDLGSAAPSYTNCATSTANCTLSDLALYDLATWKNDVARVLPDGKGQVVIALGTPDVVVVTLQYDASHSEGATKFSQDNPIPPKQHSFRTVL